MITGQAHRQRRRLTARLDVLKTLIDVFFDAGEPGFCWSEILDEAYFLIKALKEIEQ